MLPAAPLPITRLLGAGTGLYRRTLTRLLPLSLAAALALLVPASIDLLAGADGLSGALAALTVLAKLAAVFASSVLSLAVVARAWHSAAGDAQRAAAAVRIGLGRFLPFLLSSLLYGLAVLGGTVLLIVPGLYLSASLVFFPYAIVAEKQGAVAALRRSHLLVRGHWWRVTAILSVPLTVLLVLFVVVQIVPLVWLGLTSEAEVALAPATVFLFTALGQLANAVAMPWAIAIGVLLYHDLRLREAPEPARRAPAVGARA
jgi:hypothetical protein